MKMQRKQLKRGVRGWRMLPNSRSVARPSRWGNPYKVIFKWGSWEVNIGQLYYGSSNLKYPWVREQAAQKAVDLYRAYAIEWLKRELDWLDPLRGLDNLYCWCAEDAPWCHGDVLIELLGEK